MNRLQQLLSKASFASEVDRQAALELAQSQFLLSASEIKVLAWAVGEAEAWRGAMVGNPDPKPLEHFDATVCAAKAVLKKIRKAARAAKGAK